MIRRVALSSKRLLSTEAFANNKLDLKGLEHRWSKMKELDQADVLDYLNEQNKKNWTQLDRDEKRALYYIPFGEWGPRGPDANKKTVSQIVWDYIGLTVLLSGIGVTAYNYNKDETRKANEADLLKKVEEIKRKQLETEQASQSKSWWKVWK